MTPSASATTDEDRSVTLRPMNTGDIAVVLELAARSPEAAQWSQRDYEQACAADSWGWVAEIHSAVVAFLIARRTTDELEILNLAVESGCRRRGLASRLLEMALDCGQAGGARRAFLEVRASNSAAIAFYKRRGFRLLGRRARYYAQPPEDALVLSCQLPAASR